MTEISCLRKTADAEFIYGRFKMKKNAVFAAILLVLGALVALAPYTFAKVCDVTEKVMKCHWTARIELFLGIAVAVLSALKFVSKDGKFQLGLNAGIAVSSIGIILVPTVLIGVCGNAMMHCNSTTRPTLIVLGILLLAAVSFQAVTLWKKRS